MTDLAILIVSYNVRPLLHDCLASIEQTLCDTPFSYQTIVVDNASFDDSAAMVEHEFPQVTLIKSQTNLGFAGGNNLGLRSLGFWRAGERENVQTENVQPLPNAILLLNPDTVVGSGAVAELYSALSLQPSALVVGPRLRYGDGSLQSTRRRFPTVGTLFWESTLPERWWPGNPWVQRYHLHDQPADHPQRVDWLVGAALLVRADAIQRAGLLDDKFFMYSEELEWQQRIHQTTGGEVWYWPAAQITHYEGKSSEQNLAQRHINFNRSKILYACRQFGPVIAWLLARFLQLTFVLQWLIEGAKWALGHKRALRAARMRAYQDVVRALSHAV